MATSESANTYEVNHNIEIMYQKRRIAVYALCLNYAARVLRYFRQEQRQEWYWDNQTNIAMNTVFSKAFKEDDTLGFFLAHTQQYGIKLELGNDRRHEALRPIINKYLPKFQADLKRLYGG